MGGESKGGMEGRNWGIAREEWSLFWKVTDEIEEKGEKDASMQLKMRHVRVQR